MYISRKKEMFFRESGMKTLHDFVYFATHFQHFIHAIFLRVHFLVGSAPFQKNDVPKDNFKYNSSDQSIQEFENMHALFIVKVLY